MPERNTRTSPPDDVPRGRLVATQAAISSRAPLALPYWVTMLEDVPVLVGLELEAVTRCVRPRVVLTVNVTVAMPLAFVSVEVLVKERPCRSWST